MDRQTQRDTGRDWRDAATSQGLLATTESQEEARKYPSLEALERAQLCQCPGFRLPAPEPGENNCLLFEPPSLSDLVRAAPGN